MRVLIGVIVALLALPPSAHAAGDYLRFTQAPSGAVSATLDGYADPCGGSHIYPMGTPSVALVGKEYDVTSMFVILDPPPCPHSPFPYTATAALGTVTDGHYTVVWTIGPVVASGEFDVRSGVLLAAAPIPALTRPALAGLIALVAGVALVALRRRTLTRAAAPR